MCATQSVAWCRRGKKQQKHYTVFVCKLQEAFQPALNSEHSGSRWVDASHVASLGDLHPVVKLVFTEPHVKKLAAAINMEADAMTSGKRPKKLGAGLFFV